MTEPGAQAEPEPSRRGVTHAAVGGLLWLALEAARAGAGRGEPGLLGGIDRLLGLLVLVAVPLLLGLSSPAPRVPPWAVGVAGLLAAGSGLIARGAWAAAAVLPWVALAGGALGRALVRVRPGSAAPEVRSGLHAVARLFWFAGGAWLVVGRAGVPVGQLAPETVRLAAVHAHAVGFAGLTAMALAVRPGARARLLLGAGVTLGVGFAVTGSGIAFLPLLEPLGALLLVLALGGYLLVSLPPEASGAPRRLLLLSGLGLALALGLGLSNALRHLVGARLVPLELMLLGHGAAVLVFALAAGLGHALLAGERRWAAEAAPLLLYDGECGFCNKSVQLLLELDRRGRLTYAPLQGPTAEPLLLRHGVAPSPGAGFASIVLVRDPGGAGERALVRSAAGLELLEALGPGWSLLSWLARAVPAVVRDAVYDAIARNRQRLAPPTCAVPSAAQRARFLP